MTHKNHLPHAKLISRPSWRSCGQEWREIPNPKSCRSCRSCGQEWREIKKHIKVSKKIMTTFTWHTRITYFIPDSVRVHVVDVADKNDAKSRTPNSCWSCQSWGQEWREIEKHIKVSKKIMTTITWHTRITYFMPDSVRVNLGEVAAKNDAKSRTPSSCRSCRSCGQEWREIKKHIKVSKKIMTTITWHTWRKIKKLIEVSNWTWHNWHHTQESLTSCLIWVENFAIGSFCLDDFLDYETKKWF